MQSFIQLTGMKFHAFHGVLSQEKKVGNTFIVDLTMYTDLQKAILTDELSDTINYSLVYEIVKKEMEIPSDLLEHIAGRITKKLKESFINIEKIEVSVTKLNPPIGGEIESASVTIKE